MKKIILIIGLNLLLAAGQLALAIGRSADGVAMTAANSSWQQLAQENANLASEIYAKSSLPYIASQSAQLGLASGRIQFVGPAAVAAARRCAA